MSTVIEIPYKSTERSDTWIYKAKLAIWRFITSAVMLFGALFSTYVLLRTGADTWEHGAEFLNVPLATINTLVLIISSVTMVMSWASLKTKNLGRYKFYMGVTILCGVGFLVIKSFEY